MGGPTLRGSVRNLLFDGTVIPAHPLAIDARRRLDATHQRALTRYYIAAGAGGVAVGVHTTQFSIREKGLLEPVLSLAIQTVNEEVHGRPFLTVAGVRGGLDQSLREARLAAGLGYDLALVSPLDAAQETEDDLLVRVSAVTRVIPVFAFYLQPAVGGRRFSRRFWAKLFENDGVVAVKVAPFDRYETISVMDALVHSGRENEIALYTGNDDNIVADLLTPFVTTLESKRRTVRFVGGLLGQWAVWTKFAVHMLERLKSDRDTIPSDVMNLAGELTDSNAAIFDAQNGFKGVIAGTHEVLRRQGLMQNRLTLDPAEDLSAGQLGEIDRVLREHPSLHAEDDAFVAQHLLEWLE